MKKEKKKMKKIDLNKILLVTYTLVDNQQLLSNTKELRKGLNLDYLEITGEFPSHLTNHVGEYIKFAEEKKYDWVIFLDVDVFCLDDNKLLDLLQYMSDNEYDYSGLIDGGTAYSTRKNPLCINACFMVFNLEKFKDRSDYTKIAYNESINCKNYYDRVPWTMIKRKNTRKYPKFDEDLSLDGMRFYGDTPYGERCLREFIFLHTNYDAEAPLNFWLIKNDFKCLYLEGDDIPELDRFYIATKIKDHKGDDLMYSTWLGSQYQDFKFNKNWYRKTGIYSVDDENVHFGLKDLDFKENRARIDSIWQYVEKNKKYVNIDRKPKRYTGELIKTDFDKFIDAKANTKVFVNICLKYCLKIWEEDV